MRTRTRATTINRVCGSGLKAIMLAAAEIRAGDADVAVAGGMESMNGAPYLLPNARFGYRLGDGELIDATAASGSAGSMRPNAKTAACFTVRSACFVNGISVPAAA